MSGSISLDASYAVADLRQSLDAFLYNLGTELAVERPTLRDQFAMAALQGLLARGEQIDPDATAQEAFIYADAMLEARKSPAGEPAK